MAIWLDKSSRILVQGMTGSEGTKHTRLMVAAGSQIVAGVTPGKAGQEVDGIPVLKNTAKTISEARPHNSSKTMSTSTSMPMLFTWLFQQVIEEIRSGVKPA